ncbi:unnamed protein product [Macrosiphum euphorbiae]|nr:unnamed protein product [Macrosiphum euphorbiae]
MDNSSRDDEDDYDFGSVKIDMKKMFRKIEVLTTNVTSMESSLNFYGESFDEIKKKMDTVVNIVNGMGNRVMETELRCSKLEKEIDYLKIMLNNKEQASLNQSVEITGIPKTPNEDIPHIITSVANILNISIKNEDIVDTYRLKPYKNTDGKIIAKFNSTILKDSIIKSIKLLYKNKNPVTANNLCTNFPEVNVFTNDQLTKENKRLLWLSKEFSKTYGYRFVWSNSGGVYLKKQEMEQVIKIPTTQILQNLDTDKKVSALWE